MRNLKSKKGITLVALIITIIVLLILTVVAISSITDQGLFTKSQESVNKYEESREAEQNTLTEYATLMGDYLNGENINYYTTIIGNAKMILKIDYKKNNMSNYHLSSSEGNIKFGEGKFELGDNIEKVQIRLYNTENDTEINNVKTIFYIVDSTTKAPIGYINDKEAYIYSDSAYLKYEIEKDLNEISAIETAIENVK